MRILLVSEGAHEGAGALQALVTRAVNVEISCVWRNVKDQSLRLHHGKGSRLFKRAIGWMREARRQGFDGLVLVVDEDGDRQRVEEVDAAQDDNRYTGQFPRALGVAVRSFDAWMLADEKALSAVLECHVPSQKAPEEDRNPKATCSALLAGSQCGLRQRDLYAKVAEQADLQTIGHRCPAGFSVFLVRLESALVPHK